MFEYRCTKCGKMRIAPLDIFALKNFICWECKKKEMRGEAYNDN